MTPFNGFRVLVVDDEFLIALDISDLLAGMGCDVIGPVSRLAEADRISREQKIDGAVLDINIAGERIDPVARRLRDDGVPIILVTGYGDAGISEDLRSAPRLLKPIDEKQFQALALQVFVGG